MDILPEELLNTVNKYLPEEKKLDYIDYLSGTNDLWMKLLDLYKDAIHIPEDKLGMFQETADIEVAMQQRNLMTTSLPENLQKTFREKLEKLISRYNEIFLFKAFEGMTDEQVHELTKELRQEDADLTAVEESIKNLDIGEQEQPVPQSPAQPQPTQQPAPKSQPQTPSVNLSSTE